VKLSVEEKKIIAQRAAGSYAILARLGEIIRAHRKNRIPEDAPYLAFGRLVMKRSWDQGDYEEKQAVVLALFPEPFGAPFWKNDKSVKKAKPKKHQKTARKQSRRKKPPERKSAARALLDLLDSTSD